jgi:hypothetical protein
MALVLGIRNSKTTEEKNGKEPWIRGYDTKWKKLSWKVNNAMSIVLTDVVDPRIVGDRR